MADQLCLKSPALKIAAILLVTFVFITTTPQMALTAEKELVVIGSSPIYNNVTSARNAAVAEGLLSAVESVALEMIPAESLESEFETISTRLYNNRLDFTQGYQVLKEINTDDYYRLLIRASVSVDKIRTMLQEMGITMAPEALPKVLFLVAEKHADDLSFYYWWRTEGILIEQNAAVKPMKQVFRKQGFPVIDNRELAKDQILADLDLTAELTATEAIILGQRTEADLVVFGKATAKETQNKMGRDLKTFQGSISLTAVDVKTEAIVAATDQTETAAGRDVRDGSRYALSNAGFRAGKILSEKISAAWLKQARQSGKLKIHISGEGDILANLVSFRETLRNMEGVTQLQTAERSRNKAILSVKYEGSPRALADKILLTAFDGFGVNIYEMTENRINMELLTDQ